MTNLTTVPNYAFQLHMPTRFALALALLWSTGVAMAGSFEVPRLATDKKTLETRIAGHKPTPAPTLPQQTEFDSPRVSANRRHVGWLALYENCCSSYDVPLALVVMDQQQRIRTFTGIGLPIFRWCFLPDSQSVAYMQTTLHGTNFEHYERRSLTDGRLLAEYEFPHEEVENAQARRRAPAWVRCVPE